MATVTFSSAPKTIRYKVDTGRVIEATILSGIDDTIMFSALVDGVMFTSRQPAVYRTLQATLKAAGLNALGKCETLRRVLHEHLGRKDAAFKAHWADQLTVRNRKRVGIAETAPAVELDTPVPAPQPEVVADEILSTPEETVPSEVVNSILTGTIHQLKALAKATKCPRYSRLCKADLKAALALHLGVAL